jgi:hypothetical protein
MYKRPEKDLKHPPGQWVNLDVGRTEKQWKDYEASRKGITPQHDKPLPIAVDEYLEHISG